MLIVTALLEGDLGQGNGLDDMLAHVVIVVFVESDDGGFLT